MFSSKKYVFLVMTGDAACILFSLIWVTALRRWNEIFTAPNFLLYHGALFVVLTILWLWIFHLCGLYEPRHLGAGREGIITVGIVTAFLFSAVLLYFTSGIFIMPAPKTILLLASVLAGFTIYFLRSLAVRWLWKSRAAKDAIFNTADDAVFVLDRKLLGNSSADGYHEKLRNAALRGLPVFSSSMYRAIETEKIPLDEIGAEWLIDHVLSPAGSRTFEDVLKRALDVFVALVFFIPALAAGSIAACWIKIILGGPVIYRQVRVGKGGRQFSIWKFRTMLGAAGEAQISTTRQDDPRIPKTMKWIRMTHLDEIPQLVNVFKGEMSLVGPRPEQVAITTGLEQAIPDYWVRHVALPGITGWAQVNMGYAETEGDAKERFAYDLYYLANRSFWLDFSILLRTLRNVLFADGR
ncbi:MAG: sugar transferase [Elusimicrobia bacterium]|nr:sugar transferase [Elusimicrobiota bacterium]